MRSTLTSSPASRAAATAVRTLSGSCVRSRAARTCGTADCMPMERRVTPDAASSAATADVTVSGLASTVISAPSATPKVSRTPASMRARSPGGSSVGVPPPKNTVDAGRFPPARWSTGAASSISRRSVSAYSSWRAPRSSDDVYVLKSQYPQRTRQKGTCRYTLNSAAGSMRVPAGSEPSEGTGSPSGRAEPISASRGSRVQRRDRAQVPREQLATTALREPRNHPVQHGTGRVERADGEPDLVVVVPVEHERLLAAHDGVAHGPEREAHPPRLLDGEDDAQLRVGAEPPDAAVDADRRARADERGAVRVEALLGLGAAGLDGVALGVEAHPRVHGARGWAHVGDVEPGTALGGPRHQRLARGAEARFAAADPPRLLCRDAALRRILHQIRRLGRPDSGIVDGVVTEGSSTHGFQPTSPVASLLGRTLDVA